MLGPRLSTFLVVSLGILIVAVKQYHPFLRWGSWVSTRVTETRDYSVNKWCVLGCKLSSNSALFFRLSLFCPSFNRAAFPPFWLPLYHADLLLVVHYPSLFILLSWIEEVCKARNNCAQLALAWVCHFISLPERPGDLNLGGCLLLSLLSPLDHPLLQHGGRKVYFGLQFKMLQSTFSWLHCLWACSKMECHSGRA